MIIIFSVLFYLNYLSNIEKKLVITAIATILILIFKIQSMSNLKMSKIKIVTCRSSFKTHVFEEQRRGFGFTSTGGLGVSMQTVDGIVNMTKTENK